MLTKIKSNEKPPPETKDETSINYNNEINSQKIDITSKIKNLERKIEGLVVKEGIIIKFINDNNNELQNLESNNFKYIGQKQSIIIKQMEALNILQDTIIKFEDIIFKYRKLLLDIENNKINVYFKAHSIKDEEEDSFTGMITKIENLLNQNDGEDNQNDLLIDIKNELKDGKYVTE